MVSDVINGWMKRPDWSNVITIPVAVVPLTPTPGNLLAASIGVSNPIYASYLAIKGRPYALDVFSVMQVISVRLGSSSVLQKKQKRLYGLINIYWGEERFEICAESDVERGLKFAWRAVSRLVTAKRCAGESFSCCYNQKLEGLTFGNNMKNVPFSS